MCNPPQLTEFFDEVGVSNEVASHHKYLLPILQEYHKHLELSLRYDIVPVNIATINEL